MSINMGITYITNALQKIRYGTELNILKFESLIDVNEGHAIQ